MPAGDGPNPRSAEGTWRGPAKFQFTAGGARAADANAIGRMVIELQADGRVRSFIDEAGCKLSCLHTQFVSSAGASLDLTASASRDGRFTARYSGHLLGSAAAKESELQLHAVAMPLFAGRVSQASIEAVLRR